MQEEYIKDFEKWARYSKELEARSFEGFAYERQLWWCSLGVNIGSEQDGKNDQFERPVLILRVLKNGLLLIVPTTSKIDDQDDRVEINILGKRCQLLLNQRRTVSDKRLLRKISWLDIEIFQKTIIKIVNMETSVIN